MNTTIIMTLIVIGLCILGLALILNNSVDKDEPELPDTAVDDEPVIPSPDDTIIVDDKLVEINVDNFKLGLNDKPPGEIKLGDASYDYGQITRGYMIDNAFLSTAIKSIYGVFYRDSKDPFTVIKVTGGNIPSNEINEMLSGITNDITLVPLLRTVPFVNVLTINPGDTINEIK